MTGVQIGMDKDQSDDAIVPSQFGTSRRRRRGSMRFAEARGHDIRRAVTAREKDSIKTFTSEVSEPMVPER